MVPVAFTTEVKDDGGGTLTGDNSIPRKLSERSGLGNSELPHNSKSRYFPSDYPIMVMMLFVCLYKHFCCC